MIDHKMEMKLTIERLGDCCSIATEIDGEATGKELAQGLLSLIDQAFQRDQKLRTVLALLLLAGEHVKGETVKNEGTIIDGRAYEAMRKRGQA